MKPEIEIERLKEIDFLNLFELEYYDCVDFEGKIINFYKIIEGNYYDYRKLREWIKDIYNNLENYFEFLIIRNDKKTYLYRNIYYDFETRENNKQKIEKYFLKVKLEQKLITINKEKVRKL